MENPFLQSQMKSTFALLIFYLKSHFLATNAATIHPSEERKQGTLYVKVRVTFLPLLEFMVLIGPKCDLHFLV